LTFTDLVHDRYDALSRGEKKVARYCVADPEEASGLSAREIAARSGSSAATVVRLARSLGFDGLPELQKALVTSTPPDPTPPVFADPRPLTAAQVEIALCGRLCVCVDGRRCEDALTARQVRLLLAYLALHRGPVGRDKLIDVVWNEAVGIYAADPRRAFNVLLSKLRKVLGPDAIRSTGQQTVSLSPDAVVDVDDAEPALAAALEAQLQRRWHDVIACTTRIISLADAGLLPGYEAPWLEEARRDLDELAVRARELQASAGLELGGSHLAAADRAARELVAREPYRESGHLLLMEVHEAQGNPAEALRVYDDLRNLLRAELGIAPSAETQELHRTLLG